MQYQIDPGDYLHLKSDLCAELDRVLRTHPLLNRNVIPKSGRLILQVVSDRTTGIQHGNFLSSGEVVISLNDDDLFDRRQNDRGPDTTKLSSRLHRVLAHELAHFIDARLDRSFGYSDSLKPVPGRGQSIHYNLWDAYIDGRLGSAAPYTLGERQQHGLDNDVPEAVISEAWEGAFCTYNSIVSKAQELGSNREA